MSNSSIGAVDYHWEGFVQNILKSHSSSKQREVETIVDRKRLTRLIIQAKALHSTGKSKPEIYFTKSRLEFFSFIDKSVRYLIIKHAQFGNEWKYNFHDELSKKFLDDIGIHKGIESLTVEVYEHEGFRSILEKHKKFAVSLPFTIIGHALGGAVAVPLAKMLKNTGHEIREITTFGQPKITDAKGALQLNDLPIIRVSHDSDVLSLLPLNNVSYKHVGGNLKLSDSGQFFYPDSTHDNMIERSENQMSRLEIVIAAQSKIKLSNTINGLALLLSELQKPNIFDNLESPIICHSPVEYIRLMQKYHTLLRKYDNRKFHFPGRRRGSGSR